MPRLDPDKLRPFVQQIFERAGSNAHEAERVAHYLVESNLVGHDSHGIIRVSYYLDYVKNDQVRPNQSLSVIFQTDSMAIVDGNFGFGQVIGEQAMQLGIDMAASPLCLCATAPTSASPCASSSSSARRASPRPGSSPCGGPASPRSTRAS